MSWCTALKTRLLPSLAAVCLLLLPAGAAAAAGDLHVVATLSDLGWLAQQVGGAGVKVSVLCPGGADPHFLPAKPSLARVLGKADLLLYAGLELEIGWLPLLVDAARNPRVRPGAPGDCDCSQALARVLDVPEGPVDRARGDVHALGNPHYLLDPRNGARVAELIAQRLAALDPPRAEEYRARAGRLAEAIAARLPAWQARAAGVGPLVVYHQQWEYLADWLDLEIMGAIEHRPGISPSPRHVENLVLAARARSGALVVAAPWNHLDASRRVAERIGAPLLVLPAAVGALPGVDGYLDLFERITADLAAAQPAG